MNYLFMRLLFLLLGYVIGLSETTIVNDSLRSLFIRYAWSATCCLREVVESPYCNQLLFTAYCHKL